MLANDSNQGKRSSEFSLVVHVHKPVAELMAECPICGAISFHGLELVWRLGMVNCGECHLSMRLDEDQLALLSQRLTEANARITALLGQ
jgi:hypothetical protein